MPERHVDLRFSLPEVDGSPSTELGVILMGLEADRLLAGLGLAMLADDPGMVTLAVDQARHGVPPQLTFDALVEAGASRWREVRPRLAELPLEHGFGGSLRQAWERAARVLTASPDHAGPASTSYLAACWLRRDDVDRLADLAGR